MKTPDNFLETVSEDTKPKNDIQTFEVSTTSLPSDCEILRMSVLDSFEDNSNIENNLSSDRINNPLDASLVINDNITQIEDKKLITLDNIDFSRLDIDKLAQFYLESPSHNLSPNQQLEFKDWINKLYDIEIVCPIEFVDNQPYSNVPDMQKDFFGSKLLKISTLGSSSALVDDMTNLRWRAIHDTHHCQTGNDFSFEGEFNSWRYICQTTNSPSWIQSVIFSDLVFQASSTEYINGFLSSQKNIMSFDY